MTDIKVAELNTPSDGNGITGLLSAVFGPVFFNEMGNKKKKKWEIKGRKKLQAYPVQFFA